MSRSKHPKKEVEKALQFVESQGWRIEISKRGHAWGKLYCPFQTSWECRNAEFCVVSINSTPKNDVDQYDSKSGQ